MGYRSLAFFFTGGFYSKISMMLTEASLIMSYHRSFTGWRLEVPSTPTLLLHLWRSWLYKFYARTHRSLRQ